VEFATVENVSANLWANPAARAVCIAVIKAAPVALKIGKRKEGRASVSIDNRLPAMEEMIPCALRA
jgi:hypothetical protein